MKDDVIVHGEWLIGDDYTIQEVTGWFTRSGDSTVFRFKLTRDGEWSRELYATMDFCLVSMIGEKYTGMRGASGEGVGTAADWFAKMVGMTFER